MRRGKGAVPETAPTLAEVAALEIRLGVKVVLNDGTPAGRVNKVVLEPAKGDITHLVVGDGGALRQGRMVPIGRVLAGNEERVQLTIGRDELEASPEFDEDDFVPLEYGDWPGPYPMASQPIVAWGRPYPVEGLPLAPPEPLPELPYVADWALHKPAGTTTLAPGMDVLAFEGQPLGRVARVLGDTETGKATYLVLVDSWEGGENRLVPVSWIREVRDGRIVLVVGPRVVRELAPYPAAQRT